MHFQGIWSVGTCAQCSQYVEKQTSRYAKYEKSKFSFTQWLLAGQRIDKDVETHSPLYSLTQVSKWPLCCPGQVWVSYCTNIHIYTLCILSNVLLSTVTCFIFMLSAFTLSFWLSHTLSCFIISSAACLLITSCLPFIKII